MRNIDSRVWIAGVPFDNVSIEEAVARVRNAVGSGKQLQIVTPNIDHLALSIYDRHFLTILNGAELSVADGMGVVYLSRILKTPLKENVGGRLLFMELCRRSVEFNWRLFFLGSTGSIASDAAEILRKRIAGIQIVGAISPSLRFGEDERETLEVVESINSTRADILFVGVGAPKSEKWIHANRNKLNASVALVMGHGFDLIVGKVKKAPQMLTRLGLEWSYRLVQDPGRLVRRYVIRDMPFVLNELGKHVRRSITCGR
jgi:N-acetylglucosaminyldiphosphoundecaprenol N-acetyl-beta-D-mannosaminyltransferase